MTNNCCCIEGSTLVLMADGCERPLREIRPGDEVRTETGCARVRNIIRGVEPSLIRIAFDQDRYLDATREHPLFTDKGIEKCHDVIVGDRLRTQDADVSVVCIREVPDQTEVYNLEFEEATAFFANGLLVGDLALQSRLTTGAQR